MIAEVFLLASSHHIVDPLSFFGVTRNVTSTEKSLQERFAVSTHHSVSQPPVCFLFCHSSRRTHFGNLTIAVSFAVNQQRQGRNHVPPSSVH